MLDLVNLVACFTVLDSCCSHGPDLTSALRVRQRCFLNVLDKLLTCDFITQPQPKSTSQRSLSQFFLFISRTALKTEKATSVHAPAQGNAVDQLSLSDHLPGTNLQKQLSKSWLLGGGTLPSLPTHKDSTKIKPCSNSLFSGGSGWNSRPANALHQHCWEWKILNTCSYLNSVSANRVNSDKRTQWTNTLVLPL